MSKVILHFNFNVFELHEWIQLTLECLNFLKECYKRVGTYVWRMRFMSRQIIHNNHISKICKSITLMLLPLLFCVRLTVNKLMKRRTVSYSAVYPGG